VTVEENPFAKPPLNPKEKAWRYMDFAKFVSLISRRELFLCNLEGLAKDDPHDGLLSAPNYRHRQWKTIADLSKQERKDMFSKPITGEKERIQFESQRNSREYWVRRRFYDRRTLLVNCWHLNDYESGAMWSQYALNGLGIAVTSSFPRLCESLAPATDRFFVGTVQYLDWDKQAVDNTSMLPFSKRMSYQHERELRIVYWDLEVQQPLNVTFERLCNHMMDHLFRRITGDINWKLVEKEAEAIPYKAGMYVPITLETLIDEVYVSPTAPDWFLDIVQRVCKQFNLSITPRRSDILSAPIR
jgi:hypothetical protein